MQHVRSPQAGAASLHVGTGQHRRPLDLRRGRAVALRLEVSGEATPCGQILRALDVPPTLPLLQPVSFFNGNGSKCRSKLLAGRLRLFEVTGFGLFVGIMCRYQPALLGQHDCGFLHLPLLDMCWCWQRPVTIGPPRQFGARRVLGCIEAALCCGNRSRGRLQVGTEAVHLGSECITSGDGFGQCLPWISDDVLIDRHTFEEGTGANGLPTNGVHAGSPSERNGVVSPS